jgi:hypothetical protein
MSASNALRCAGTSASKCHLRATSSPKGWDRSRELAPGERDRLVERAAALSLAEINEFAKRFYDPARFTMIRVETE